MLCHNYVFFDCHPSITSLSELELTSARAECVKLIKSSTTVKTFSFTTLGFKVNTRVMLWFQADEAEQIQDLLNDLLHTTLGRHMHITYTLLGLVRPSNYTSKPTAQEQAIHEIERGRYLIVYPFTKTTEWHLMSQETRREIMMDHIRVGHKFAPIKQLLLYAYGVDDHEFVLSYESESLLDFQSLVMDLRATEARRYTLNDTPIFTCIHKPLAQALEYL
jgi:chlorite dismutase